MHRVVAAHLSDFQKRFPGFKDQSRAFEAFVNYSILRSFSADAVAPDELIYDGDDPGIDGILIFIDDAYVASIDEVEAIFKDRRRDCEVAICFTQAKSGEAWAKSEVAVFQSAVQDFLSEVSEYPHSEYIKERRDIFDAIIRNVGKLKNGKPTAHLYFATTARTPTDREIVAAFKALSVAVESTGLFAHAIVSPVDRDALVDLWSKAEGPVEAKLPTFAMAAFPKAPGVEEGYVATVRARDFIERVLSDANGKLRQRIFEENVRDFIGSDAGVNAEMVNTISDLTKQKRFGILNNGVTIISPDVRVQGNEIFLRDFQIVNGCQTSNVLFESRDQVSEDATLMLKIVETDEAALVDEIVRSTNRQTEVQDEQFLATLDCIKGIEKFFNARGSDEAQQLYFERRKNQFSDQNIPAIRIFDIREVARCVGSMFFDKPDIASRYPNRLTGELQDLVFRKEYIEDIYYTASYAFYRLMLLISNRRIDARYSKLRWHVLMAIRYYLTRDNQLHLASPKIRKTCEEITRFMSAADEEGVEQIKSLCSQIADINEVTRDRVKGQSFVLEVRQKALAAS